MNIVKNSRNWFLLSSLLVIASLVVIGTNYVKTGSILKYGIDFTGGMMMELTMPKEVTSDQLKQSIQTHFSEASPEINKIKETTFLIRTNLQTSEEHDTLMNALQKEFGDVSEEKFNLIGPTVGETMKKRAVIALGIALVMIVFYIAFAFRKIPKRFSPWKFGITAIIALAHDILITTGIFALANFEINALFITALLTVLGFSVHDTIVVFDRTRENLKTQRRNETFGDITEKSLWQTMRRSINTSVSTLIVLVALIVLGAPSLQEFVLALIIGIVIGTYSSIFLASTLLVKWQKA